MDPIVCPAPCAPDSCSSLGSTSCGGDNSGLMEPVCGDADAYGNVVVGPTGEALPVVHEPIQPCTYQSSLAVTLQSTVDYARRIVHGMGFRPYRVFLVWVRRNRRQEYVEFRRQELVPVMISSMNDVDLRLESVGLDPSGGVWLTEISPAQVDEKVLRGYIDGRELGDDEHFFYEVVRQPRYPGELPLRSRFTVGTTPHFNATAFQWEVGLVSQAAERSTTGEDQTFKPSKSNSTTANRLKLLGK